MSTTDANPLADDSSAKHILSTPPKPPPAGFKHVVDATEGKYSVIIIYTRYSTNLQSSDSTDIQVDLCRAFLKREGLDTLPVKVFSDDEVSGTLTSRPEFDKAMDLVDRRIVAVFCTAELSRVSRSDTAVVTIRRMQGKRCRFIAVRDRIDTNNRNWAQSARFTDVQSSAMPEQTAERVRDGLKKRMNDGNGSTGNFPDGYDSSFRDSAEARATSRSRVFRKDVFVDEERAEVVRLIFKLFNSGWTIPLIVSHLIATKVPPPRRCKTGWKGYTVRRILGNKKYIGIWRYGDTFTLHDGQRKIHVPSKPEDAVEVERVDLRIVTDEVFFDAQQRLAFYKKTYGAKEGGRKRGPDGDFRIKHAASVTGGLIHCSECGAKLQVSGSSKDVVRLGCPNHRLGLCSRVVRVVRDKAEKMVTELVLSVLLSVPEWLPAVMHELKNAVAAAAADIPQERDTVEKCLDIVDRQLANIADAVANGMDIGPLHAKATELSAERDALKVRLGKLGPATACSVPDEAWVRQQLRDLAAVLPFGDPALLMLLRKCIGRIDAEAVVAPGKKRGFCRLKVRIDVAGLVDGLLRRKLPPGVTLLLPPITVPNGVAEFTINLGKPTRPDEFTPQIVAWRHETPPVKWREISRRTGMTMAGCMIAYKRYRDGTDGDAGSGPAAA